MKKCLNCGAEILEGENFCKDCGTPVQNNIPEVNQGSSEGVVNPAPPTNTISQAQEGIKINQVETKVVPFDSELLDAYIGKNAEKIKNKKFSWCTLLFNFIYLFYRKMWLYGILVIIASLVINIVVYPYGGLFTLIGLIVFSFKIKGIYLKDAQDKINNLIKENPTKTKEEIKALCMKKGGTTIVPVIIYIILCIAVPLILTATMLPDIREKIEEEELRSNGIDKVGDLVYKVPSNMSPSKYNEKTSKSYSSNDDEYCYISLKANEGRIYENNPNVYLSKNTLFKNTDVAIFNQDATFNNLDFKYATVESESKTEYTYAIYNKDMIYSIHYFIYNDSKCDDIYKEILDSLEFEE